MNEPYTHIEEDWLFRIQPAVESTPNAVLVAIHGWTGNETSMDIFTRKLRQTEWVIYPRAPFESPNGGYSWTGDTRGVLQEFSTFQSIGVELISRLRRILAANHLEGLPVHLAGFSQGAALALVLSLEPGLRASKVGCLAGFLPLHMPAKVPAALPEYYVAHGKQDTIVPIDHAYQVVRYLEQNNARVEFCETDTGHKLGAACFKQLENFFLQPQST